MSDRRRGAAEWAIRVAGEHESLEDLGEGVVGEPTPAEWGADTSDEFDGLRLVQRHQKVYAALGDRMKSEIHALSFKALTPAEHAAGK